MSELRGARLLELLLRSELSLPPKRWTKDDTSGCESAVSREDSLDCRTSSIPRRSVIISRIKQATAEAADPLAFDVSKRLEFASPAN